MSVSTSLGPLSQAAASGRSLRFGVSRPGGAGVEWLLKRNCSIAPRQLLAAYGGLSVLSLGIAGFFWSHGATLVMPFAWLEILAVGAAIAVHGRHVGDRERIEWSDGRMTVELVDGTRTDRIEFVAGGVRVEPQPHARSLVRLTGRGRTVEVGRHVRPEWRPLLAKELRDVLRAC